MGECYWHNIDIHPVLGCWMCNEEERKNNTKTRNDVYEKVSINRAKKEQREWQDFVNNL